MMLIKEEREFYDRHLRLKEFGEEAQLKLKEARVLVIGAGGLGCPVLQYLAAAGVGTITVIDHDVVSLSNLQRQVLYSSNDVGKKKVLVAAEKLTDLNPFISIYPLEAFFTVENAIELVVEHDVIIDCTDNFGTRYLINDACVISGRPFIYGAISKFSGQVAVFNESGGPTYRCLFPEFPDPNEFPSCSEVGVVGVLPGIVGTLQAIECIKLITGIGETLSGKLLLIDALTLSFSKLKIGLVEENQVIRQLGTYEYICADTGAEIAWDDLSILLENDSVTLIDVRTEEEYNAGNLGGLLIPVDEIVDRLSDVPTNKEIIVYCKSGMRSQKARGILIDNGLMNVRSLRGGFDACNKNR